MSRNQSAASLALNVDTTQRRKRKRPARREDDDDGDDFMSNACCTWLDRKTQYDWQVIDDPEACFRGGRFRWIDVKTSAEAQTWPVGIRFQNVHTGQVVGFDGLALIEQGVQPLTPAPVRAKRPYPVYVRRKTVSHDARRDGKDAPLSSEYQRKCLSTARCFMDWLRDAHNYKNITNRWLRTFRRKNMAEPDEPISFTLDEVVRIANTPVNTLAEERIQAGCIFLFLSGMRIKAFLTTPIKAINMTKLTVRQWPSLGVHTKMQKKAVTQILDIPEVPRLPDIFQAWDKKVRDALSPDRMWYAPLSPQTGELDPDAKVGKYRDTGFRKDLVAFLQKAGLERKSTHKFRHGHIGFLRGRAESYRELEAIANNTMQTMATMLHYGRLNSEQAHTEIEMLCKRKPQQAANSTSETDTSAIMRQLQEMAQQQHQLMARLEELSNKG